MIFDVYLCLSIISSMKYSKQTMNKLFHYFYNISVFSITIYKMNCRHTHIIQTEKKKEKTRNKNFKKLKLLCHSIVLKNKIVILVTI